MTIFATVMALVLTARLGVVLVGARCFPVQARPPVSHGIDPKKPHEGFGGQAFPVFPVPMRFAARVASRATDTMGGCGCTKEFVTSMRNGHGPCT